jgi:foldase protein PrsA
MRAYAATLIGPSAAALAGVVLLYGCASPPGSPSAGDSRAGSSQTTAAETARADGTSTRRPPSSQPGTRPGAGAPEIIATPVDARPAALVNGRMLEWGSIRDGLTEAAGGEVLAEVILDRLLHEELQKAGIVLGPDALAGERALLLSSLHEDVNQAVRLLQELRERSGLGPARFEMLLRRNASLRALVRDTVVVSDEAVAAMHERRHGPRRQARLIVVKSLEEAQRAIDRLNAGEAFADVAAEASIDPSAARGGLLEPISAADPTYPRAIREALGLLKAGEISPPVLLPESFAILTLVREIPADDVSLGESRDAMARLVRLEQERLLMEQMARRLLGGATIAVFDDSLKFSFDLWRRRGQVPQ